MNVTSQNPYIGPRTFRRDEGHLFFGRDREADDLLALVVSERVLLFYAQSGAGKSSLLNTRLLPELEDSDFEVLPVGRLQGDPPQGIDVENVYLFNLMSSMVQQKFAAKSLVGISFSQFLAVMEFHEGGYLMHEESLTEIIQESRRRRILIIDQFEEIFTTHLTAWKKRDDFFRQLAQAIQDDPYLTVILIMRDDYIAALDPYAHLLPGGLRMRYYMQRLSRESALKAIKNPVARLRPYANGVAERLVDDLANITIQRPDGAQETQPGQYVEPVQLQVVCHGLWEDLPPARDEITAADLLEVGNVDQSLERFYDRRVAAVAQEENVPERVIREWFEKELITSNRTRNMVLQDANNNTGLREDVIQAMRGDLVRAELRAGQIWYELSHDRLIRPILTSNTKWKEKHLSGFQRRVELWTQQGKSESLLLKDQELEAAKQEASTLTLTPEEGEFLKDCETLQKRIQSDRRQRQFIAGALVASLVFLIVAFFALVNARAQKNNAEKNANDAATAQINAENNADAAATAQIDAENSAYAAATAQANAEAQVNIALAGSLAAQANSLKNSDHALALLLGVEAYKREAEPKLLTKPTLFDLLQFTAYKKVDNFNGVVNSAAVSPDGKWIAIASCNKTDCGTRGEIQLFNETIINKPVTIPGEYGIVYSLAFYQYGERLVLAAGGCVTGSCSEGGGQITLWEISDGVPSLLAQMKSQAALVKTIKFSPDGKFLASGSYDTTILLWDLNDLQNPQNVGVSLDHASFVNDISFSPDGNYLVSAGDDRTVYVWNISDKGTISQPDKYEQVHTAPVTSVAVSPDGKTLASAGYDNKVRLWDWNAGSLSLRQNKNTLEGHTGYVTSLAFSADGTMLASAGFDSKIILWNVSTGDQIGPSLSAHTRTVNQVTFGSFSDEPYLISVGNDRTAIQWDLFTRNPLSRYLEFSNPENQGLIAKTDEWLNMACQAGKRNLKDDENEWKKYLPNQPYEKTCAGYE